MGALRARADQFDRAAAGARRRAVDFLLANQGRDGLWRDFDTPAGEASSWPTAFIGAALQSAAAGSDALERAADALATVQNDDGGWGYNEAVPSDADSTAWALLVLVRLGRHEDACRRAASCLVGHQSSSKGGVATYSRPGPIRRFMGLGRWMPFRGWCRPHTEVTAVAGRALTACPSGLRPRASDSAWKFVRSQQQPDGHWNAYWWTTPHYTTAQAVELARSRREWDVANRAAGWALRHQDDRTGSAFVRAMSLSILRDAAVPSEAIGRAVHDVIALQQPDGSWPSEPILRIPVPAETDPDGEARWHPIRFAGGIEVGDQHRLFTSAACVAALSR